MHSCYQLRLFTNVNKDSVFTLDIISISISFLYISTAQTTETVPPPPSPLQNLLKCIKLLLKIIRYPIHPKCVINTNASDNILVFIFIS